MDMNSIVLIGPPGSGKSTVGRFLSKRLERKLLDTDSLIEEKTQKKIAEMFVDEGEEAFRRLEMMVLEEVLQIPNCIISLGGGAPIKDESQKLIKNSDVFVVFLDISLAAAAPRVGFNRDRPLLLGNPRAQWQSLNEARRPIYQKLASLSIKVDDMSVDQIVQEILLAYGVATK
jgi:shikimate kinase